MEKYKKALAGVQSFLGSLTTREVILLGGLVVAFILMWAFRFQPIGAYQYNSSIYPIFANRWTGQFYVVKVVDQQGIRLVPFEEIEDRPNPPVATYTQPYPSITPAYNPPTTSNPSISHSKNAKIFDGKGYDWGQQDRSPPAVGSRDNRNAVLEELQKQDHDGDSQESED